MKSFIRSFQAEGNNGGSYVRLTEIGEGMLHLEVGETCIRTIDQQISVTGLACILSRAKELGLEAMLNDYLRCARGSNTSIQMDSDIAVNMRKKKRHGQKT